MINWLKSQQNQSDEPLYSVKDARNEDELTKMGYEMAIDTNLTVPYDIALIDVNADKRSLLNHYNIPYLSVRPHFIKQSELGTEIASGFDGMKESVSDRARETMFEALFSIQATYKAFIEQFDPEVATKSQNRFDSTDKGLQVSLNLLSSNLDHDQVRANEA